MLIVNDPGDPAAVFPTLQHSTWHGCTFADLVFPGFLFLLGVTTHLSLTRRAGAENERGVLPAIWKRAAILFGIGLCLNAYPFFEKHLVAGPDWLPVALQHVVARLASMRITGVLQRIGLVYLVTALLARRLSMRGVVVVVVALLLGYWAALTLVPVPGLGSAPTLVDPAGTLPAWLDRTLLDWESWGLGWHLWDRQVPYDPEGLLSTVPAIGTALLGVLAGRWLTSPRPLVQRINGLALCGVLLVAAGLAWGTTFPINKPIWTSSYVLLTAGIVSLMLACLTWILDVRSWRGWADPWLVFGTNPIVVYVGAELLASILRSSIKWRIGGRLVGTGGTVVQLLTGAGVPASVASLAWALGFTGLCYALVRPMYRRRIFVKI